MNPAIERAIEACEHTARRLSAADVAQEALARFVPEGRRMVVFRRPATMLPLGSVWRLGSVLLTTDAALYAVGHATRSAERGRPGYQSLSLEARRDIAAAALRGGYEVGTPVNYAATPLPLDERLLDSLGDHAAIGLHDGEVRVRWRAGASLDGAPTLAQYMKERADLLVDPLF